MKIELDNLKSCYLKAYSKVKDLTDSPHQQKLLLEKLMSDAIAENINNIRKEDPSILIKDIYTLPQVILYYGLF